MKLYPQYRFVLTLLIIAAILSGCASTPNLGTPDAENVSLVFGHIDMDEAPSELDWVQMKRMRPVTKTPYYNFWVVDGTFFRADVPEGTYKFTSFGGHSGWKNTSYNYNFPNQGKGELDRRISKPGIYYVGSYKYEKIDTGFFSPDQFNLVPTKAPSELEMLEKMLPYADDPYWKNMITKRMQELKK